VTNQWLIVAFAFICYQRHDYELLNIHHRVSGLPEPTRGADSTPPDP